MCRLGFLVPTNRNWLVILSPKGFHCKAGGGGEGGTQQLISRSQVCAWPSLQQETWPSDIFFTWDSSCQQQEPDRLPGSGLWKSILSASSVGGHSTRQALQPRLCQMHNFLPRETTVFTQDGAAGRWLVGGGGGAKWPTYATSGIVIFVVLLCLKWLLWWMGSSLCKLVSNIYIYLSMQWFFFLMEKRVVS